MKDLHVSMVFLSIIFFIVRFYWMITTSDLLKVKLTKILPHVVDTLLLGSAIYLAIQIEQYPLADNWLTIKLTALLMYIVLGSVALKRGKTKMIRVIAGGFAILTFAFIVSVAVSKSPMGFLAAL